MGKLYFNYLMEILQPNIIFHRIVLLYIILFYNGSSEYILVAQSENRELEILNENLYNEFIKDFSL